MFRCYLSKGQRVCLLAFYDPKLPYGLGLYMKTDWIVNPFRLDPPVRFGLILWLDQLGFASENIEQLGLFTVLSL